MVNSNIFAKALLQRAQSSGIVMSNLKLQKLVYYCQGYHLAQFGVPIFDDKIEAWTHGPVVRTLYHSFKRHGSNDIDVPEDQDYLSLVSDKVLQTLDLVLLKLGNFNAGQLRTQSHKEAPWRSHYDPVADKVDGLEITHKELTDFFTDEMRNMQDAAFSKILDSVDSKRVSLPDHVQTEDEFHEWIMSF